MSGCGSFSQSRNCLLCWTSTCHQRMQCRSGVCESLTIPWTFYQRICHFKFKTRHHWKLTDCIWTCCHWLWLNLLSSLTLLRLCCCHYFWTRHRRHRQFLNSWLFWRKSLQNHESFRVHYGGRPFTAEAIKENLKVPDGQQWIACFLAVNDGLFLHFVPLSVNDICSTRSVNDSLCWR